MAGTAWTAADTAEAKRIWDEYQTNHDVSDFRGQAAGIDPETGRIWFGQSALDAVKKMKSEGIDCPLFFIRVGYDSYLRKGGHR